MEYEARHAVLGRAPQEADLRESVDAPGLNERVRKPQILLKREAPRANPLSGPDETNKIFLIEHFGLKDGGRGLRAERRIESSRRYILVDVAVPRGYFHLYLSRRAPYPSHERR